MISLGIDTSNYTSSVALMDGEKLLSEMRIPLRVKEGERGLRQQEALFQHWNNIPVLIERLFKLYNPKEIDIVGASTRPRPVEGSYMPVFTAGEYIGRTIANTLKVPFKAFSHQEGHIAAAAMGSDLDRSKPLLAAHLSGGTLEIVRVDSSSVEKIGGTKDISYGQLLDRAGVAMGNLFPAGKAIDEMAMMFSQDAKDAARDIPGKNPLCKVSVSGIELNLSGLETQTLNYISKGEALDYLPYYLMERISESFVKISENALKQAGLDKMLVTGGVACSSYLRNYCALKGYIFGDARFCSDNAVGVAILAGMC